MSAAQRKLAVAAAVSGLLLLQACGTLPVAVKPVKCDVDVKTLGLVCEAPRPVADGITYGDVIAIGRQDRKALLDCQTHLTMVVGVLSKCIQTMDAYNIEIDRINAEMKAQR